MKTKQNKSTHTRSQCLKQHTRLFGGWKICEWENFARNGESENQMANGIFSKQASNKQPANFCLCDQLGGKTQKSDLHDVNYFILLIAE